ncbi:hypothetical protein A3E73_01070 [Candidatus Beckwithbacteria bacterium RIFCSPHIGHO2_12_FULL_47_17]|uniref:SpoVT-AbrB domain-containing protein n=1 Tax=Candidatus Beckwithbacteria bacterium RIFCSPHIGHO2_12_FULL_47_17 TaxID=1797460 RepID=A0A1F5DK33_9BACT|nr:MAG: hypothetical protein A3E73_01070 [Candidatus Beckwithbacteria bacterium RIFCSPHIGHO2_12_FULL_47_17]
MPQLVTITSKRQLTIPVDLFRKLNLEEGQRLLAYRENRAIKLEPATALVEQLAGSIKIPARFKKQSLDKIIDRAKKDRFKK